MEFSALPNAASHGKASKRSGSSFYGSAQRGTVYMLNRLVVCLLMAALSFVGHSQSFTSIDIKPAASNDLQNRRVRVLPNGDLIATSINAMSLIEDGYNVPGNPSDRLLQLPQWAYAERYDIEAKSLSRARNPRLANDPQSLRAEFQQMLTDRFHLVMRAETKTVPVYSLVVAPGGSKLTPSATSGCIFDTAPDGCHTFVIAFGHPLIAQAVDMDDLAQYIENWTDLPVVNKTNLAGLYTITSSGWRPMRLPPPPPGGNGNVDFSTLPTLDSVLLNLGLKLRKDEAAIPFYTVEHIEHPTDK